jgi:hypothetical protein
MKWNSKCLLDFQELEKSGGIISSSIGKENREIPVMNEIDHGDPYLYTPSKLVAIFGNSS